MIYLPHCVVQKPWFELHAYGANGSFRRPPKWTKTVVIDPTEVRCPKERFLILET